MSSQQTHVGRIPLAYLLKDRLEDRLDLQHPRLPGHTWVQGAGPEPEIVDLGSLDRPIGFQTNQKKGAGGRPNGKGMCKCQERDWSPHAHDPLRGRWKLLRVSLASLSAFKADQGGPCAGGGGRD